MMKKLIPVLLASLALPSLLRAQSLPLLYTPVNPRSSAMGGAGVALDADPWSPDNNFAAAAVSSRTFAVGAAYDHWAPKPAPDTRFAVGSWLHTENLAFGLSVKGSFMQPVDVVSSVGEVTGKYNPNDFGVALAAAWQAAPGFGLSLTARLISSSLTDEVKATSFCADLGAFYTSGPFRIGAAVSNLGTALRYGDSQAALPLLFKGGVSWVTEYVDLTVEADNLPEAGVMACLGVEAHPVEGFFLRGGYHLGKADKGLPSFGTCGIGAALFGLAVEVSALFASPTLGGTICGGISYSF